MQRTVGRRSAWFLLGLLATATAPVVAAEYEITVAAGKHDRANVPVAAFLSVPDEFAETTEAQLVGDDSIPAQLTAPPVDATPAYRGTRQLNFILPSLKAGETRTYRLDLGAKSGDASSAGFRWQAASAGETVLAFDKPVLKYVHPKLDETSPATREQTYKPFHHVYSPDGSRIVTKGPGGKYTHHRGLYFGFNRVSYGPDFAATCDVWHCKAPAYQNHEKVLDTEEGFILGRHALAIGWHGAKGEKFADERRELTVYNVAGGQFIDFTSVVRTEDGPIRLDGDPQHAGFHFRADNEVAESTAKQTYYLRPDGKGAPGETRNWSAKSPDPKTVGELWKVMSFVVGGKRYSALRLDTPTNPGEARGSERDYGRFGGYFEYEITQDKPLEVHYRVVLKDGEFTADEAIRLSNDFIDPPQVTAKKL